MDNTELLKEQLALETLRREVAETRLAQRLELETLRTAQIEHAKEAAQAAFADACALRDKYQSEHYRNADEAHKHYRERYETKNQELFDENKQLRAALALKEKELCELRGGC